MLIISIINRNDIKYNGDFCHLNCFYSIRTKHKLQPHEKYAKITMIVMLEIPQESNKIFRYTQGRKSIKKTFIVYAILNPMHKILSFPLKISSVNATKCTIFCGFNHNY